MTETHTPYQRGRRAAERGAPREVPKDLEGMALLTQPVQFPSKQWLEGFDSIHGTAATRGAHYQAGQFQAWDVTRYMSGDMAQAWQYVLRCDVKSVGVEAIEDLHKSIDFIEDFRAHEDVPSFPLPDAAWKAHDALDASLPEWKRAALAHIASASSCGSHANTQCAIQIIKREIARREAV